MVIQVLSQELSNQIAAGEVIQNQAALIKELMENSLDAKSTKIIISLEEYGLSKISIEDNGVGISKDELSLAPLRHATSKISNFDDLYSISTMGFRGEALASIFSIAQVELISKPSTQEYAYKITNENYSPVKFARENGTSVIVKNLFHNTPARLKYLRSRSYELREIVEVVKSICLIHPQLDCTLIHNSKTLFRKTQQLSLKENMFQVLQIQHKHELFEISKTNKTSIINGYILNPNTLDYSSKKYMFVYLNSRPIQSNIIYKAIMAGIGTNIHAGRFPMCVINLIVDPQLIDVNIHPSKKEVKFELETEIFTLIKEAIEELFNKENIMPRPLNDSLNNLSEESSFAQNNLRNKNRDEILNSFDESIQKPTDLELNKSKTSLQSRKQNSSNSKNPNYFSTSKQYELDNFNISETHNHRALNENETTNYGSELNNYSASHIYSSLTTQKEINLPKESHGPLFEYLKEYRIIGQLHKTYILVEVVTGLIIIDQHVAEEKFYFELFRTYFNSSNESDSSSSTSQTLLTPKIIKISPEQEIIFKEVQHYFEKIGFEVELLQQQELIIRKVPLDLKGKLFPTQLVVDVLDTISSANELNEQTSYEEYVLEHLSSLSCKSSIRAGDELTNSEMRVIIEKLKVLQEPFNCPHGRPIIIEFTTKDFEKMFKR